MDNILSQKGLVICAEFRGGLHLPAVIGGFLKAKGSVVCSIKHVQVKAKSTTSLFLLLPSVGVGGWVGGGGGGGI